MTAGTPWVKAKVNGEAPPVVRMAKKDRDIYDYAPHKTYPAHGDKSYSISNKRSKVFTADDGRLNERE